MPRMRDVESSSQRVTAFQSNEQLPALGGAFCRKPSVVASVLRFGNKKFTFFKIKDYDVRIEKAHMS